MKDIMKVIIMHQEQEMKAKAMMKVLKTNQMAMIRVMTVAMIRAMIKDKFKDQNELKGKGVYIVNKAKGDYMVMIKPKVYITNKIQVELELRNLSKAEDKCQKKEFNKTHAGGYKN